MAVCAVSPFKRILNGRNCVVILRVVVIVTVVVTIKVTSTVTVIVVVAERVRVTIRVTVTIKAELTLQIIKNEPVGSITRPLFEALWTVYKS